MKLSAIDLHKITSGEIWAQQFIEQFGLDMELDDARAWFANAIECGRTHGQAGLSHLRQERDLYAKALECCYRDHGYMSMGENWDEYEKRMLDQARGAKNK